MVHIPPVHLVNLLIGYPFIAGLCLDVSNGVICGLAIIFCSLEDRVGGRSGKPLAEFDVAGRVPYAHAAHEVLEEGGSYHFVAVLAAFGGSFNLNRLTKFFAASLAFVSLVSVPFTRLDHPAIVASRAVNVVFVVKLSHEVLSS